jgi:hypothetical protein
MNLKKNYNNNNNNNDNIKNPWDKVLENIDINGTYYKEKYDVSRMREIIFLRKNDYENNQLKK